MRIVCAPDSFKESIDATEAARAMVAGVTAADPAAECRLEPDGCPVADGGEGTLAVLLNAMGGTLSAATVTGPRGAPIHARFGITTDGSTGLVELAEASGLTHLAPAERDPTRTTTYGTGELIAAAMDAGCRRVIVGVGGSATCDGGAGLAQALGAIFLDAGGTPIESPLTGGDLSVIRRVELARDLPEIIVACDVRNPLTGPTGAAAVYGPQKGATTEQVARLDRGLAHLANVTGGDPTEPRTGAAGGAAFGLATLCAATLRDGSDIVLEAVDFERRCRGATLVITGEGCLDATSLEGKAAMSVAGVAHGLDVPVIAICGTTAPGHEACLTSNGGPIETVISLEERFGRDRALTEPAALIATVVEEEIRARVQRPQATPPARERAPPPARSSSAGRPRPGRPGGAPSAG